MKTTKKKTTGHAPKFDEEAFWTKIGKVAKYLENEGWGCTDDDYTGVRCPKCKLESDRGRTYCWSCGFKLLPSNRDAYKTLGEAIKKAGLR